MKKVALITFLIISLLLLPACSNSKLAEEPNKWDCSVTAAATSSDEEYIITYSNEEIVTDSGELTFQNQNDFDIVVHLCIEMSAIEKFEIAAGGSATYYAVEEDVTYTVGVHAPVEENTEIKLMVYDSDETDVF